MEEKSSCQNAPHFSYSDPAHICLTQHRDGATLLSYDLHLAFNIEFSVHRY